jgi:hypothetical protein
MLGALAISQLLMPLATTTYAYALSVIYFIIKGDREERKAI